ESYVSAERNHRDFPAGAMPVVEADQFGAETQREGLDGDAVPARHEVVAHFVDEDDNGQNHDEGGNGVEDRQAEEGQFNAPGMSKTLGSDCGHSWTSGRSHARLCTITS